jgi:carboxyl-terminal processing protease
MILDIRNNMGGLDDMAADILGLFYPEKTLYEYQKVYGSDQLTALYIQPAEQRFTGKIIALINSKCVSSGEGLAMGIKNLPNGETLGFFGTNGSFGLAGSEVKMPGGITVEFPSGQSLDKNKSIQLDSRNGIGGVSPSIRIPMTEQNAIRIAGGEDVELDDALRILTGN